MSSNIDLGGSIPSLTAHAVSVSLPTWTDNIDYEEGAKRVMDKISNGYPRFYIHDLIAIFADDIVTRCCSEGTRSGNQKAMLFPSRKAAERCRDFIVNTTKTEPAKVGLAANVKIIDLCLDNKSSATHLRAIAKKASPSVSAVIFHEDLFPIAKQYWQHSGDGISSRQAEFCHALFEEDMLVMDSATTAPVSQTQQQSQPIVNHKRGPKRYRRDSVTDHRRTSPEAENKVMIESKKTALDDKHNAAADSRESTQFLEERFGRNLDLSFVNNARIAIRRRLAGYLLEEVDLTSTAAVKQPNPQPNSRGVTGLSEDDVYLYPCGMNAIFNTHRMLLAVRGQRKSISFGFPYVDTLKILQKFGPGCLFYGHGSSDELDDLEARLQAGERYLAFFCEFPGNPMLKSPDLRRIRQLADKYDFAVVVDETIGNSVNVQLLPHADVVVNSLTKVFSGDCNVMGGSAILNPQSRHYLPLKRAFDADFEENNYWVEDVLFMERNSRDFVARIRRINDNAEAICHILQVHPLIKDVYYPKYSPTKRFYDECRTPTGGYGGLLSFTFHRKEHAMAFFDRIETAKGPSLGTNFTLTSPYVLLAHYWELEWAAGFGVPADLLRVSVGVENVEDLKARFAVALEAAEAIGSGSV
ncbi:cystathionine gamma-synthase [Aspergillus japonicus CBS 114.51]|uniref:cystathionine gamma-synthase n=2 Tax=Aspergillus TaxID=5052 RepID=A0A2V5HC03_ASPV1|nr:cystathionine gamma-synthase [Aspergillus japonicus CBS 114.51]PYI19334.1 cystathionine gamma-synthase [Aspergillus violaceofuscus CBS 115571]RAH87527.1 cystathionine gamma-synthase [Aspergillus japonicus CBS 114.51]